MTLMPMPSMRVRDRIEIPTLGLVAAAYLAWGAVTLFAETLGLWLAVPLLGVAIALHSSLQHEIIHGHPFRDQRLNDLLVFPALGLVVPYERFRDLHLAHHHDPLLTDPYDDPESNYLDPVVWDRLGPATQAILSANNTLLGRIVLGPLIGAVWMIRGDLAAIRAGDARVRRAWLLHAAGIVPVAIWLAGPATVPVWAYLLAAWVALGLLRIRTFLEHRAHERSGARSVIIEDRGPLALLFLNNNYHAVHHAHPNLAWYRLPAEFARRRDEFLRRNDGYVYRSYGEVFRRHFLRRKDPVAHPLVRVPARRDRAA